MRVERWETVMQLFHAALERPEADRAAFLARACDGDASLRAEVTSLLAAHLEDDDFMEAPAFAQVAVPDLLPAGGRLGPYRLVREVGRGGMGAVYLAERDDGEFCQQVAIKLVKRGMDTELILRRFRHERQILAQLQHPNIAQLLDGGTTADGLPYFVMEYIEGEPIDRYCAARGLTVEQRLSLFRDVCAAVHYAHQRLVVHRDIKPANILVTAAGVPKLLDFGIAKLLTADDGPTTVAGLRAMTPEYASPEQARGEAVTTLSDVYSLGIVLYELLAGRYPHADATRGASAAAEPTRPSARAPDERTRRRLRGDLDTIVLAALRPEPERRYASAEQLSDDVRRHLAGLAVRARPDTPAYRASTFVRRNRVGVAAAGLVLATLLGAVVATSQQAHVARVERARAERRFGEVRALATSFLFELHDAIAHLPGATPARALLVRRALGSLDGLAREAQDDPGLQRELAAAYAKLARLQGDEYDFNLGDTRGAEASYRKSLAILEKLARANADDPALQDALARSDEGLGSVLTSTGDLRGALASYERARRARRALVARHPADRVLREELANLDNQIGDIQGQDGLSNIGDARGALASYRESVRLRQLNYAAAPRDVEARVALANGLMNLGYLEVARGEQAGVADIERSVGLLEQVVAERPHDAVRRAELSAGYARLRQPLVDAGRVDEAIAMDRKMIAISRALATSDTVDVMQQRTLGVASNYLGRDLRAAGRPAESVPLHRQALAIAERLAAADPASADRRHDVAMTRLFLAEALAGAGADRAALAAYRRAAVEKERLRRGQPSNARHGEDLALIHTGIGNVLVATGAYEEADSAFRAAIPLAEAAAARDARNRKAQSSLAAAYLGAARLHARQAGASGAPVRAAAHRQEAHRLYRRSLDIWQEQRRSGTLSALDLPRFTAAARGVEKSAAARDPRDAEDRLK